MAPAKSVLSLLFTAVWLVNGLFCKVLNLVPRHQRIVARILGEAHPALFTKSIGCLEVLMAVWILSRVRPRLCTVAQIVLVATMNVMEAFLAPDLLMFGKGNLLVAAAFIALLVWHERTRNRPESTATFIV